jgi:O-antigen/teichoic acid export membrane protein
MPLSLIGNSIGQVFFQQATKEKQITGKIINTFNTTAKKLIIIGIPFFLTVFFVINDLFTFVFGEKWQIAGTYAQIMIPLFFIRFIVATVSAVDTIMERQNIYLLFNIILLTIGLLVILIFKEENFEKFLSMFSTSMGLVYLVYGYILYKMSKNEFKFRK